MKCCLDCANVISHWWRWTTPMRDNGIAFENTGSLEIVDVGQCKFHSHWQSHKPKKARILRQFELFGGMKNKIRLRIIYVDDEELFKAGVSLEPLNNDGEYKGINFKEDGDALICRDPHRIDDDNKHDLKWMKQKDLVVSLVAESERPWIRAWEEIQ